ncbi:hypothetical protein J2Y55_002763 [Bosea sp. BE125]|nr:hypothetical protein [Bosea sp. BE125]
MTIALAAADAMSVLRSIVMVLHSPFLLVMNGRLRL